MAQKGTFAAYQQLRPVEADLGKELIGVAKGFEAKRAGVIKEKALKLAEEKKAKAAADKLRQDHLKDVANLTLKTKDYLDIDMSGIIAPVTSEIYKIGREKYASTIKELEQYPERRGELTVRLNGINDLSKQMNGMTNGFATLANDLKTGLGTKYDENENTNAIAHIMDTMSSAATEKLKKNPDGSYNWGKYMRIDDLGSPDMKMTMFNEQGEELVSGSMASIPSKLSMRLEAKVDLQGGIQDALKATKATFVKEAVDSGDQVMYTESRDDAKTLKSLEANLRLTLTPKMIKKAILQGIGDTEKEVIKNLAKSNLDTFKDDVKTSIYKSPGSQDRAKQIQSDDRTQLIDSAIMGNETGIKVIRGKKWGDIDRTGLSGTVGEPRREGNKLIVPVSTKKEGIKNIEYDMTNPSDINKFAQEYNKVANSATSKTLYYGDLAFDTTPAKYELRPEDIGEFAFETPVASVVARAGKGLDALVEGKDWNDSVVEKALAVTGDEFEKLGLNVDVNIAEARYRRNDTFEIKDKDGKVIVKEVKVPKGDKANFVESLKQAMGDAVAKVQEKKPEAVVTETVSIGGTDYSVTDAVELYAKDPRFAGVSKEDIEKRVRLLIKK
jgi:hypothetical protein